MAFSLDALHTILLMLPLVSSNFIVDAFVHCNALSFLLVPIECKEKVGKILKAFFEAQSNECWMIIQKCSSSLYQRLLKRNNYRNEGTKIKLIAMNSM